MGLVDLPPDVPPEIAESVRKIIQEHMDGFVMIPDAVARVQSEHPRSSVSVRDLHRFLIYAAGKAGIPIGLEWND